MQEPLMFVSFLAPRLVSLDGTAQGTRLAETRVTCAFDAQVIRFISATPQFKGSDPQCLKTATSGRWQVSSRRTIAAIQIAA
jgi:hypothetical protein